MKTRRVRRQSLRRQILLRTLVVGLVPLIILAAVAVLGLVNLSRSADDSMVDLEARLAEDSTLSRLSSEAASAGRELDLGLAQHVGQLQAWARDPLVRTSAAQSSADASTYLSDELGRHPEFLAARYTDRTGTVIGSTDATSAVDRRDSVLWQRAWNESVGIDAIQDLDGTPLLPVAVAIADNAGRPIGVLEADLDLEVLQSILAVRSGQGVTLSLVSDERVLLARADAETESGATGTWDGARALDSDELDEGTTEALRSGDGTVLGNDAVFAFSTVDFAVTLGGASNSSTAPTWLLVANQANGDAFASLASLEDLDGQIDQATTELGIVVLIVLLFGGFVAVAMAARLSHTIVGPVNQLIQQADHTAQVGIPDAVSQLMEDGPDAVEIDHLDVEVRASDELTALADSFNTVQRRALQLAGGQAAMRHNTLEMIGHLGRRNQRLVKRQLSFLDELEKSEEDPERLSALFTLDHLATRMRRSAESFLVIAGHRAPSKRSAPVRVELVVQGALAEVEHFERVDTTQVEPVALAGRAVTDVAHILAELVENAVNASPPQLPVEIFGTEADDNSYTLTICDHGLGMAEDELTEANHILASDTDLYLTPTRQLGLTVVSKLAKRYDLVVALAAGTAGGIAATVTIPAALVEAAEVASSVPGGSHARARAESASTTISDPTVDAPALHDALPAPEAFATPGPAPDSEPMPSPEPMPVAEAAPQRDAVSLSDASSPSQSVGNAPARRRVSYEAVDVAADGPNDVDLAWPPPTIDQASSILGPEDDSSGPSGSAGDDDTPTRPDAAQETMMLPVRRRRTPPAPITSSTAVVDVPEPDDDGPEAKKHWPKPSRAPRIEASSAGHHPPPSPEDRVVPEPSEPDTAASPGPGWVHGVVGSVLEAEATRPEPDPEGPSDHGRGPTPTDGRTSAIPRRVSRRIPGTVEGRRPDRQPTKRSVATSHSAPEVEAEAEAVRSRWDDFYQGRADASPEPVPGADSDSPASPSVESENHRVDE